MYCKHCGAQLPEGSRFCSNCGAATEIPDPQSYAPPQSPYYSAPQTPTVSATNTLAIVGFILSFFIAIAGLVCSIIGYRNAPQFNGNGKGLALAGIIISAVSMVLSVILSIVLFYLYLNTPIYY